MNMQGINKYEVPDPGRNKNERTSIVQPNGHRFTP